MKESKTISVKKFFKHHIKKRQKLSNICLPKALIPHLIRDFRLHNNKFTTRTHKSRRLFCTERLVLNAGLKDF